MQVSDFSMIFALLVGGCLGYVAVITMTENSDIQENYERDIDDEEDINHIIPLLEQPPLQSTTNAVATSLHPQSGTVKHTVRKRSLVAPDFYKAPNRDQYTPEGVNRFVKKTKDDHEKIKGELASPRGKATCWIWWTFPQLMDVHPAQNYLEFLIKDYSDAYEYITHRTLKKRYIDLCEILLNKPKNKKIQDIMNSDIDVKKLQSSLTLFWYVADKQGLKEVRTTLEQVLTKYYGNVKDEETIKKLNGQYYRTNNGQL